MERLMRQIAVRNERNVELWLYEFSDFREFRTTKGARQVPGRKRYALNTGETVNYIDEDHFELLSTGEILSRSSATSESTS
jgi:hypothetical protein